MLRNNYSTNKKSSVIELAFIMLFSLYYILPSVSSSINFILLIGFAMLYVVYVFVKDPNTVISFLGIFIAMFLVAAAYTLLTDTKTISGDAAGAELKQLASKFSQYLFMYLPSLFFVRIVKNANQMQKTFLLAFFAVLIGYVILQTLQELAINPNAIRQWEQFDELEDDNIGNYYFVYSIPILIVTFTICMQKLNKFKKIISVAVIVFLFYFLIRAQYTLALLISIIGLLLQVFLSIKNGIIKIVFLFISILFAFFIPDFLLFASNNVESEQMSLRFQELYAFFGTGDTTGYNLNGRLTLYGKSILAFLQSPIWGHSSLDFDGHATYFTILSDTGLIGSIPFYYLLLKTRKKVRTALQGEAAKFMPIFFCLLCMGFTNPVHNSLPLSIAVWFIAPLAIDVVFNKGEKLK